MQGMLAVRLLSRPLASLPGSERTCELCQGEDALAVVPLQLLLADACQQADVVRLLRLLAAPLAELADLAMLVERQPRRLAAYLEPPGLVQHLLRLPIELRV